MPIARLKGMQPIRANISAASDMTFTVEGVVRLQDDVSGHVTNTVFGVAPKLATKMILKTAFIDK